MLEQTKNVINQLGFWIARVHEQNKIDFIYVNLVTFCFSAHHNWHTNRWQQSSFSSIFSTQNIYFFICSYFRSFRMKVSRVWEIVLMGWEWVHVGCAIQCAEHIIIIANLMFNKLLNIVRRIVGCKFHFTGFMLLAANAAWCCAAARTRILINFSQVVVNWVFAHLFLSYFNTIFCIGVNSVRSYVVFDIGLFWSCLAPFADSFSFAQWCCILIRFRRIKIPGD